MHAAQHQENDTHFTAQRFKDALCTCNRLGRFQIERNQADLDQVKADDEQMVHAIR